MTALVLINIKETSERKTTKAFSFQLHHDHDPEQELDASPEKPRVDQLGHLLASAASSARLFFYQKQQH